MTAFVPARLDVSMRRDFVEIHDGDAAQVAVLDLTLNTYGTWQLVYDIDHPVGQELLSAMVTGADLDRWGFVFRTPGNDTPVASGPVTTIIASDGRRNGVADDAISVWGVTDLSYLRERLIFPDPATDISATPDGGSVHTWSSYTRTKTGPVEDLIIAYVRENLGDLGVDRRRLGYGLDAPDRPTLVVPTSLGRGPTVTYAPTANEHLLTMVSELAPLGDLQVDLVQTGRAEMTLVVRQCETRTGVIWSTTGSYGSLGIGGAATANGMTIKRQRRPRTSVIGSGYGDDATVGYVRRDAPAPDVGVVATVREEFIKGSSEDAATLILEAEDELIEDSAEIGIDVEPTEGSPWHLGVDYELGDRVIGVFYGEDVEAPLRRVLLTHDEGTLTETAAAEYADQAALVPIFDDLRRRIARLTRRA